MHWIRLVKPHIIAKFWIVTLLFAAMLLQPYRLIVVKGSSMYPTYSNGSTFIVEHIGNHLYHGQVVVLKTPLGNLIKRIKYLPGDKINQLKIGDSWHDLIGMNISKRRTRFVIIRKFVIPPDMVYVLGDNADNSVDSTTFGPVPIKDVWGALLEQRRDTFSREYRRS